MADGAEETFVQHAIEQAEEAAEVAEEAADEAQEAAAESGTAAAEAAAIDAIEAAEVAREAADEAASADTKAEVIEAVDAAIEAAAEAEYATDIAHDTMVIERDNRAAAAGIEMMVGAAVGVGGLDTRRALIAGAIVAIPAGLMDMEAVRGNHTRPEAIDYAKHIGAAAATLAVGYLIGRGIRSVAKSSFSEPGGTMNAGALPAGNAAPALPGYVYRSPFRARYARERT